MSNLKIVNPMSFTGNVKKHPLRTVLELSDGRRVPYTLQSWRFDEDGGCHLELAADGDLSGALFCRTRVAKEEAGELAGLGIEP